MHACAHACTHARTHVRTHVFYYCTCHVWHQCMHMHTHTASAPINVQEYFVLLDLIGAERPLFYDNFVESSAIFQRLVKIGEHTHLTVWGRVGEGGRGAWSCAACVYSHTLCVYRGSVFVNVFADVTCSDHL